MQSIGLDVAYTKTQTDEVLVVVKDTSHKTDELLVTVKDTAHQTTSKLTDITATLEDIRLNVKSPAIKTAPSSGITQYLIPNRLVQDFIGREDILTRIKEGFDRPNSQGKPKIVTISGLGGQGKTQLALKYCRHVREKEIKTIFWVDAMSKELVLASFKKIAGLIADPGQLPEDEQTVHFVLEKLTAWPKRWLLIFDNHDDPSAFRLQDYFPGGDQGRILVTSRNTGVAKLDRKNAIALEGLSEIEALDLLFNQCVAERTESNNESGVAIVKRLGYHTLAIAQAGSYILLRKLNLDQFLDTFETRKDGILKHNSEMSEYRRQLSSLAKETTLNVFTTWELSFELLKQSNKNDEHKEDLLTLFAFFDSKDISEELFRTYFEQLGPSPSSKLSHQRQISAIFGMIENWNIESFETILVDLAQMTLIQPWFRDKEENCHVSLHPLIRDWIRLRTDYKSFQECTVNTAYILAEGLSSYQDSSDYNLPLSTRLAFISHIDVYIDNYKKLEIRLGPEDLNKVYADLQNSESWFCDFLNRNAWSTDAKVMAERLSIWQKSEFGVESSEYLTSLSDLANIARDQGDYKGSESLLRQVFQCNERILGPEHESTLTTLHNLASVLCYQGNLEEAEMLNRRVLMIYQKDLGEEHLETLNSLHNLALVLSEQGRYEEAEKMYRRVLKIREKVTGVEHPITLKIFNSLAHTLQMLVRYEEVEEIHRRVLKIRERVLGNENPDTISSVWNLACNLYGQNFKKEALVYFERAAMSSLKVLGPDHPDTVIRMKGYLEELQPDSEASSVSEKDPTNEETSLIDSEEEWETDGKPENGVEIEEAVDIYEA